MAGQDFLDYEHIIVDPGSTDGSRKLLADQTDPRIKTIFDEDSGPADGLNHGLEAVEGRIFLYLNADDELAPGALGRINQLHDQHPDVDVLIGNGWTIDHAGSPVKRVRSDKFSPTRYALSVGTVLQQATSFKASLMKRGLKFNVDNKVNWDTEFLFDAFDMGATFRNTPDQLGYFRLHAESITVSGRYEEALKARRRALVSERVHIHPAVLAPVSIAGRLGKLVMAHLSYPRNRVFPGLVLVNRTL